MSWEISGQRIPLKAGADLSTHQFKVVYASDANTVALATDRASHMPLGILQNKPDTGQAADIMISGISKAVAGDSISVGANLSFDTYARVVTTPGDGYFWVGTALEAASAADEVIPVLIRIFKA
ncbi:MAG: DUF2190 family protein [Candidatus Methanosuratincola petrocarbonis]